MQEGNKKEKWDKPKLIILTRGKPEERVCSVCKFVGGGPEAYKNSCLLWYQGCKPCVMGSAT